MTAIEKKMKARAKPVDPNAVDVSREFRDAFAYLTRHYGWSGDELADMRQACRTDIGLRCYLVLLAQVKRDQWYAQNEANGFIRLDAFMAALGRDFAAEHAAKVKKETKRLADKAAGQHPTNERKHHDQKSHQPQAGFRADRRRRL